MTAPAPSPSPSTVPKPRVVQSAVCTTVESNEQVPESYDAVVWTEGHVRTAMNDAKVKDLIDLKTATFKRAPGIGMYAKVSLVQDKTKTLTIWWNAPDVGKIVANGNDPIEYTTIADLITVIGQAVVDALKKKEEPREDDAPSDGQSTDSTERVKE